MSILPLAILTPFAFIILALFMKNVSVRNFLSITLAIVNLGIAIYILSAVNGSGMLKTHMGSWPAPFGILLIADRFSAFMLLISAVVFLSVTIYSVQSIDY